MLSIQLQNFRSLTDTGRLDIRPITILVGKNSSGKSTLTRFFPLLRQSIEVRSNTPLLWYGKLVDFGNIDDVVSSFSNNKTIIFDTWLSTEAFVSDYSPPRANYYLRKKSAGLKILKEIRFSTHLKNIQNTTAVVGFSLQLGEDNLQIFFDDEGNIDRFMANNIDYTDDAVKEEIHFYTKTIIPSVFYITDFGDGRTRFTRRATAATPVTRQIRQFYRNNLHGRFSDETINQLARRVYYQPGSEFLSQMDSIAHDYTSWRELTARLGRPEWKKQLDRIRGLYLIRDLPDILYYLDTEYSSIFGGVGYIGPSRATGERYYRFQELAVGEIDPKGENLAMFLTSLTPYMRREFANWTERYLGHSVEATRNPGHVSIMLREPGSKRSFNLEQIQFTPAHILLQRNSSDIRRG